MPKGKTLCSQSKDIVNTAFNYFSEMEKHCAGRGTLKRTSEARGSCVLWHCNLVECYVRVGISKWAIMRIWREASHDGPEFLSPAKRYKVSRWHVLVGTFNCKAIRRRMLQLYKAKESMSIEAAGNKTWCQSCQTMKYCGIYDTGHFARWFTFVQKKDITMTNDEEMGFRSCSKKRLCSQFELPNAHLYYTN